MAGVRWRASGRRTRRRTDADRAGRPTGRGGRRKLTTVRQRAGRGPDPVVGQEAHGGAGGTERRRGRTRDRGGRRRSGARRLGLVREDDLRQLVVERGAGGRRRARDDRGLRGCRPQLGAPLVEQNAGPMLEQHRDHPVLVARGTRGRRWPGLTPASRAMSSSVVLRMPQRATQRAAAWMRAIGGRTDRPVDPGADLGHRLRRRRGPSVDGAAAVPGITPRTVRPDLTVQRCWSTLFSCAGFGQHPRQELILHQGDGRRPGRRGPTSRLRPSTTRSCEPAGRRSLPGSTLVAAARAAGVVPAPPREPRGRSASPRPAWHDLVGLSRSALQRGVVAEPDGPRRGCAEQGGDVGGLTDLVVEGGEEVGHGVVTAETVRPHRRGTTGTPLPG